MEEIVGRKAKLIFSDGNNHFSKKEGIIKGIDGNFVIIYTDKIEMIPLQRIIRVELL